jgi:hypothetical protein
MPAHGHGHAAADAHDLRLSQFVMHSTNVYTTSDGRGWMKTRYLDAQALDATNPSADNYSSGFTKHISI